MTSEIRLFTRKSVAKTKETVKNSDEPAASDGVGRFTERAMLTLHAIRIELGNSYRQTIDLLSEMPGILEEIGLTRFPPLHCSTQLIRNDFDPPMASVSRLRC